MDELWIRPLRRAPRRSIDLIRECAHGNWDRDVLWRKECQPVLPVETSRRDRRVRQPVEGGVVEDVVPLQALVLTVIDACDEFVASYVMVKYPAIQADG